MHNGYKVCKSTYAFLYGVGTKHRLENIKKHYLEHGMDIRVHKNTRQLPPRALSFVEITSLVKFIENYAEQHAILLPGRIPGYKRDDIKLLPSSTSKKVEYSYMYLLIVCIIWWKIFRLCGTFMLLHPKLLVSEQQLVLHFAPTGGKCFHMWLLPSHVVTSAGFVSKIAQLLWSQWINHLMKNLR